MERDCKGIWIPIDIWLNLDLTGNEKIILFEIDSFSKNGKPCFLSDQYLGNLVGVSSVSANRIVNSLIKKGYVEHEGFDGRHRFLKSRLNNPVKADSTDVLKQTKHKCKTTNSNILISKDYITDSKLSVSALTQGVKQTKNSGKKKSPFIFKKALIKLGVSEEIAEAWVEVRKAKKAVNTEVAFNRIKAEIEKSGLSPNEAIKIAVEKSWRGFEASWILKETQQVRPARKKSVFEQNLEVMDEMFGTDMHSQAYGKKEVYDEQRDDNNQ